MLPGNTKGGSIIVPLTSCLTGLDYSVLQIKTKIVSCHTPDYKPVKQEVNGIVILPPLVFPGVTNTTQGDNLHCWAQEIGSNKDVAPVSGHPGGARSTPSLRSPKKMGRECLIGWY